MLNIEQSPNVAEANVALSPPPIDAMIPVNTEPDAVIKDNFNRSEDSLNLYCIAAPPND